MASPSPSAGPSTVASQPGGLLRRLPAAIQRRLVPSACRNSALVAHASAKTKGFGGKSSSVGGRNQPRKGGQGGQGSGTEQTVMSPALQFMG